MEGLWFYWISWGFWIYITFIMKKDHPKRTILAVLILTIVITSSVNMEIMGFHIQGNTILMMFTVSFFYTKLMILEKVYFFISSLIITLGYVSFKIFELYDPVWIFIHKDWLLAVVMVFITLLLNSDSQKRFFAYISGVLQGEVLYSLILSKFSFPYLIGSLSFLDSFMIVILLLFIWYKVENAAVIFDRQIYPASTSSQTTTD